MSNDAQPAAAAAPKKSKKLLMIVAAVVVLGGIGGGAYWKFGRADAQGAEEHVEPPAEPAMVGLDPFVVNLADPGTPRFLRLTVGIVVDGGEEVAKEFSENAVARTRLRSSILEMLAQQTAATLLTTEGKAELRKAISEHVKESDEELKVLDVLFSEFIVQ